MNGTGPRPVAKKATKSKTEMAERSFHSKRRERARQKDIIPWPVMERRREDLRPILSESGAQAMVVRRLTMEIMIVRREEEIGRTPERSETEYIIMLFMPQNCCAHMMPMTAIMAGW